MYIYIILFMIKLKFKFNFPTHSINYKLHNNHLCLVKEQLLKVISLMQD